MRTNDRQTMFIDYAHIMLYDNELADAILNDYYRHETSLRKGV